MERHAAERERLVELLIHDLAGFLAVASASINGLLHKPEQYGLLNHAQRRIGERIDRNVTRAQTLLHEMIEVSRANEGIFRSETFAIRTALGEAVSDALGGDVGEDANALEALGIFTEVKGRYRDAPFCHDPRKIGQVLRNLIGNAMKHRRSKVSIVIHGERDLVILVEDDGSGIPQDAGESVFKRFSRLTGEAHTPGFGLGLFGVKSLVEAMGGEIQLDSREDAGTRFTVRIPPLASAG